MIFIDFQIVVVNIYVFDLKIVFWALERLCGALLGYFVLNLAFKSSANELKIKNANVHKTIEK